MVELTPSQLRASTVLERALVAGNLVFLTSHPGRGRTTVLRHLHMLTGGAFISARNFIEASAARHPLSLEEALYASLHDALVGNEYVYVDDLDLVLGATSSCHFYPRGSFVEVPMLELSESTVQQNKKLIISSRGAVPQAFAARSFSASIPRFGVEDYVALFRIFLGEARAAKLDVDRIFRFAPKLTAHQIKIACDWHRSLEEEFTTEQYIEYLRSQRLASNVDLAEIQEVELHDLEGLDDVLRNLEIHIVLPLENDALAGELGLRPKRGVLLYGAPGTGKTTVGRALAHRLRGKFFLIDGTFIAGTNDFYNRVHGIFESAKNNSPSIIFIDDADAIFEDGEERGLYRYLLTMFDGLESEGMSRVCVIMTAMNLNHLPPALVRSGRVELWLEMKLPDREARDKILARHVRALPPDLRLFDTASVLDLTEGLTGADLKRLVEDAKGLYAFDRSQGRERPLGGYFVDAANGVRENKLRYEQAEMAARVTAASARAAPTWAAYLAPPAQDD